MRFFLTFEHTYRTYVITTLLVIVLFVLTPSSVFANALDTAAGALMQAFTITVGGGILLIGGLLLDNSINLLVIGMGSLLNGNFGTVVNELWLVTRDIFNILFIFGLIYIGIKTILNSEDSSTRRSLGHLIVAALFINFSLYITQAIVDVSNILALQIYNQITLSGEVSILSIATIGGISGAFMQVSNLTNVFSLDNEGFFYAFFNFWFFIIAGLVFAWGAILLVTRFVALVIYMIFSPVMFLGWVIPNLDSYTKKWWGGFLKQCFFAPAFLFMLFLSIVVLDKLAIQTIQEGEGSNFFGMILSFTVIIGFLVASIKVAQMAGVHGAGAAMGSLNGLGKWGGRFAGGATVGMAARVLRATAGQAAQAGADNENLKEAASKRGLSGTLARAKLNTYRTLGDASFDPRRVGGVGKKLGVGEGKKGGYKTRRDEVIKKEEVFSKSLGEVGEDDVHVKRFIDQKKEIETKISNLKIDKEAATTAAKKREVAEKIRVAEKELKEVDKNLKREKQRRQIGSSRDAQIVNKATEKSKEYKKKLREHESEKEELQKALEKVAVNRGGTEYEDITKKIKETAKEIAKTKKRLREAEEAEKKVRGEHGGYAGIREESGILVSALAGRTPNQNREAGKKIRKTNEKKIKSTKEDTLIATLTDEVKKSQSKK